jgi:hypothetical protein
LSAITLTLRHLQSDNGASPLAEDTAMHAFFKSASTLLSAGLVGLATGAALYQAAQPAVLAVPALAATETTVMGADGVPVTRLVPLAVRPMPVTTVPITPGEPPVTTFSASVAKPVDAPAVTSDGRSPKLGHHVQAREKRNVPRHAHAHGKHHPA